MGEVVTGYRFLVSATKLTRFGHAFEKLGERVLDIEFLLARWQVSPEAGTTERFGRRVDDEGYWIEWETRMGIGARVSRDSFVESSVSSQVSVMPAKSCPPTDDSQPTRVSCPQARPEFPAEGPAPRPPRRQQ